MQLLYTLKTKNCAIHFTVVVWNQAHKTSEGVCAYFSIYMRSIHHTTVQSMLPIFNTSFLSLKSPRFSRARNLHF